MPNRWEQAPAVQGAGPRWASAPASQEVPDFPGRNGQIGAGEPEGHWSHAWRAVRESIFGTPERQESKERGDLEGVAGPTTAELADGAMNVAMFFGGPGAVVGASRNIAAHVPGVAGRALAKAGAWAAEHPMAVDAAAGAIPGALSGNEKVAAGGAITGALLGRRVRAPKGTAAAVEGVAEAAAPAAAKIAAMAPADATRELEALVAAGRHSEAQAVVDAMRRQAAAAPTVAQAATRPAGPLEVPDSWKAATQATARKAAVVEDLGRKAATTHNNLMSFAKGIAKEDPKVGEKIWMLLDESGAPIKRLTPDQAGAAARKGLPTTWVKNLWTSPGTL